MVKKTFSCADHIDEFIDIFLDEYESMPILNQLQNNNNNCNICAKIANYELLESEVNITWE